MSQLIDTISISTPALQGLLVKPEWKRLLEMNGFDVVDYKLKEKDIEAFHDEFSLLPTKVYKIFYKDLEEFVCQGFVYEHGGKQHFHLQTWRMKRQKHIYYDSRSTKLQALLENPELTKKQREDLVSSLVIKFCLSGRD